MPLSITLFNSNVVLIFAVVEHYFAALPLGELMPVYGYPKKLVRRLFCPALCS